MVLLYWTAEGPVIKVQADSSFCMEDYWWFFWFEILCSPHPKRVHRGVCDGTYPKVTVIMMYIFGMLSQEINRYFREQYLFHSFWTYLLASWIHCIQSVTPFKWMLPKLALNLINCGQKPQVWRICWAITMCGVLVMETWPATGLVEAPWAQVSYILVATLAC